MYSIFFLATAAVLLSSIVKASEISGNLGLCISDRRSNIGIVVGAEKCLESLDGVIKPIAHTYNGDEETVTESEARALKWRYDNGLLRAIAADKNDGNNNDRDLCLGPTVPELSTKPYKPYELILRDCPPILAQDSRSMRFLITAEGRVQSLAAVLDPKTGKDNISTHPYCLTIMKEDDDDDDDEDEDANVNVNEKAYLVPCQDTNGPDFDSDFDHASNIEAEGHSWSSDVAEHQVFDVYGTYSGSFLMPLRSVWDYPEPVEIAYQIGLPKTRWIDGHDPNPLEGVATDAFVEITATVVLPSNWMSLQTPRTVVVAVIPLHELQSELQSESELQSSTPAPTGGILSFPPSDCNIGRLTARLKQKPSGREGGLTIATVRNEASFVVSSGNGNYGKGKGQWTFVALLACYMGFFLFSVLIGRLCGCPKTRTSRDRNHDGKTVCMSTEEEDDDFPLEGNDNGNGDGDGDDDPEAAEGVGSIIHKEHDVKKSSETELDKTTEEEEDDDSQLEDDDGDLEAGASSSSIRKEHDFDGSSKTEIPLEEVIPTATEKTGAGNETNDSFDV